jgi:hypothetical protein
MVCHVEVNMEKIWHVGYDGMAMPVSAKTKQEAEEKAEKYLTEKGYRCNLITAREASDGYLEWNRNFNIEILR